MALDEQVLPIDFGQGVETKTDPKMVVAGKLLRLEDMVFTKPKSLVKRNGYSVVNPQIAPGTLLSPALLAPRMIHGYKEEMLCADQGKLFSFSKSQDAWVNKGEYNSVDLSRSVINSDTTASGFTDVAILGNYALYGWSTAYQTSPTTVRSSVYASVIDLQTGINLLNDLTSQLISTFTVANANPVKCVTLGNTALAIVYLNTGATEVRMSTVTINVGGGVTFTDVGDISSGRVANTSFDIVSTPTGASLTYINGTGVAVSNISTAGAVTATTTIVDSASLDLPTISFNAGNIWVYWIRFDAGVDTRINYAIVDLALAPVLAKTLVFNFLLTTLPTNMIPLTLSATQQTLYYSVYDDTFTVATDVTYQVNVSVTGVVAAPILFVNGLIPYSKPITITEWGLSNSYAIFAYRGLSPVAPITIPQGPFIQPTFFMLKLNAPTAIGKPTVVSRFASGLINSQVFLFGSPIKYSPNMVLTAALKSLFACAVETQEFLTDHFELPGLAFQGPGGLSSPYAYSFDFYSNNSYKALTCAKTAILNGSLIQSYDGIGCNELGFHLFPEIFLEAYNDGSGAVGAGTYSYLAIFQWTDANGDLHQSAPSEAKSIVVGGGNNAVHVTLGASFLTQKTNVSVAIYRTQTTGTVYYLVTDPVFPNIVSGLTAAKVQINDLLADASLPGNPNPYTFPASAVLENTTPPPSMVFSAHTNRLWFNDAENPNTIWYTKSKQNGVGISPSAFLVEEIDPKFGDIVALSEMDEKLVMFKERGIFVQSGDGSTDTGAGNSLSFPQFVPSDVGCDQLKSVVSFPGGVLFHSDKGIYLLNRSLVVSYIGSDVEAYNGEQITSGTLISGLSQIRLLAASGLTIVYDYIMGQWGTFKNHTGLSASNWQDVYVYIRTNGQIYKETSGSYLDNTTAIVPLLEFSWLHIGAVQGFERVRRLILLGTFASGATAGHGVQVQAAYDFVNSYGTAIPYTFSGSNGVMQYRERLPRQKCDTISLLIQEITTGDAQDYIDLSSICFEAAIKKGVNKLSAGATVG